MKEAQAQQEYYYEEMNGYDERPSYYRNDNYEPREYPSYQPVYKPQYSSYEKDNNYKSKKDNGDSISLDINKLKCINNNVNINGNNNGSINVGNSGRSASSPGTDEGYLGVGSVGGNGAGYDNKQKDQGFICIIENNNNNTINVEGAGDQTQPEGCVECFEASGLQEEIDNSLATLDEFSVEIGSGEGITIPPQVNNIEQLCPLLEGHTDTLIKELINFLLDPNPSQSEIDPLIACLLEVGAIVEATTVDINTDINTNDLQIAQATEDSSALAKVAKLKQQWLDLLP
jgi:hypothetical protein